MEAESDSSDSVAEISEFHSDFVHYENMLNKKSEFKSKTQICLFKSTAGGSPVWNYFGSMKIKNKEVLKKYYMCKLCYEETPICLKGFSVSTSTSNLKHHLQNVHNINVISKLTALANKKTKSLLSGRTRLLDKPETQKFANARLLVQMCCKDLRPFNIVEKTGFLNYIQAIKPTIKMPTATTLSRTALQDVYSMCNGTIKEFIKKNSPKNVSLVLDMWTDSYKKRSYINIRVIFCYNFKPVYITLKTEVFPHPYNKYAIAENINKTLTNFQLEKKEIVVISDGARNIIAAMKLNNMKKLGCSSHSLHRFNVHDILQNPEFTVFAILLTN